jgi:hypothetical protein
MDKDGGWHGPKRGVQKAADDFANAQGDLLGGKAQDSRQRNDGQKVDDENGQRAHPFDEMQSNADRDSDEQPVDGVPVREEHSSDLRANRDRVVQEESSVQGLLCADRGLILLVGHRFRVCIGDGFCSIFVRLVCSVGSPGHLPVRGLERRRGGGINDASLGHVARLFVQFTKVLFFVGGDAPRLGRLSSQGIPAVPGTPGDIPGLALELV